MTYLRHGVQCGTVPDLGEPWHKMKRLISLILRHAENRREEELGMFAPKPFCFCFRSCGTKTQVVSSLRRRLSATNRSRGVYTICHHVKHTACVHAKRRPLSTKEQLNLDSSRKIGPRMNSVRLVALRRYHAVTNEVLRIHKADHSEDLGEDGRITMKCITE